MQLKVNDVLIPGELEITLLPRKDDVIAIKDNTTDTTTKYLVDHLEYSFVDENYKNPYSNSTQLTREIFIIATVI